MAHEEQKDPVAQSTSILPILSTVELSERDNKETLVIKEVETNDAEVFGEVAVEVLQFALYHQKIPPPPHRGNRRRQSAGPCELQGALVWLDLPKLIQEELRRVIGGAPVLNIKINDPPALLHQIVSSPYSSSFFEKEEQDK